jgi:acetyl-CoA C-acetyltransferase
MDSIALSVPVAQAMLRQLKGTLPDFLVWGSVVPSLTWSNIAREVSMDSGLPPTIPAFSTSMACSTSMIAACEAAGMLNGDNLHLAMVGGADSLSRVQVGLAPRFSDWLRGFQSARSLGQKASHLTELKFHDIHLHIPAVSNRTTGLSMGEHTEITVKEWGISREAQDEMALRSHRAAVRAWEDGFFDDLIVPVGEFKKDGIPRNKTSVEQLARLPLAFDRTSGRGTITAGNSSPLTDGAAGLWVGTKEGLDRLPAGLPRAQLLDWEIAAVDFRVEGLLMAPAYAIPRLLARHDLGYQDIALWEIHEAFSGQVLFHMKALEDEAFLRERIGLTRNFGPFPRERVNPNGGSVALGHPFGATGARILSQAVKQLSAMQSGSRAIVSICADGGLGTVALLGAI